MNVVLVEDCLADRELIFGMLDTYSRERCIFMEFTFFDRGEDFLLLEDFSWIDLIFLDIFMDDLSGMDVAMFLRDRGFESPIVFVSSSDCYGVKSYEVRAFDYVLKPFTYDKISSTMDMVMANFKDFSSFIEVKCSREVRRVLVSCIDFVDYHNHYVQIHTCEGVVRTYMRFDEFELLLKGFKNFLTCFRCVMVNMDKIERLDKGGFLMKDNSFVPINRKRFKEIRSIYFDYVFEGMRNRDV